MASLPFSQERQLAELAVLRASVLTKKVLAQVAGIAKADASPVTIADFAAQALLISAIRSVFPSDGFVGEEDAGALRSDAGLRSAVWELVSSTQLEDHGLASPASAEEMMDLIDLGGRGQGGRSGRFWAMDPIDGTASFIEGKQYAVSLALLEDGREVLGVLGCPNLNLETGRVSETVVDADGLGIMLSAVKGQGATMRTMTLAGKLEEARPIVRLHVAPTKALDEVHIVDSTISKTTRNDLVRKLADRLGVKAAFPGTDMWSSHIRYATLIVGAGDMIARIPAARDIKMHIWDHAGAQLIFTEVGGRITDLDGKDVDFGVGRDLDANHGLLIAHGSIHPRVLAVLTDILKEDGAQ